MIARTNQNLKLNSSRLVLAVALLTALGTTGCVRRRLTVRTQPPGAQVFVDDQEIGTTPCSSSFVYYGTRKVTLIKDGYRTETVYQKLNPPWYQIPPLDFVSDNLLIRELRDERVSMRWCRKRSYRAALGGPAPCATARSRARSRSPVASLPLKISLPGEGLPAANRFRTHAAAAGQRNRALPPLNPQTLSRSWRPREPGLTAHSPFPTSRCFASRRPASNDRTAVRSLARELRAIRPFDSRAAS
jgi:hypothetical protein